MKGRQDRLEDLALLSEMAWNAEQARFREMLARQKRAEDAVARVDRLLDQAFSPESTEGDPAVLAQAEISWRRWGEKKRTELLQELIHIRAENADQREHLKRTFGRYDVLRRLVDGK